MEEKKFWIDFVEGKITVDEMLKTVKKEDKYLKWLNSIAQEDEKMLVDEYNEITKGFDRKVVKFDASKYLDSQLKYTNTRLGKHLNIFSTFADIVLKAFPNDNIKVDKTIEKKFVFMLSACPDYIGGEKADLIVEKLLEDNPKISKKQFNEEVKKLFNVEKKYPKWLQTPEWPISKTNKPMRFVEQKYDKKKNINEYIFEDVDTKETKVVKQFT